MRLLLTGAFAYSKQQINNLEKLGYEITYIQNERESITDDLSQIEAIVCNNFFLYNDISRLEKLKVIQLTSSGMDRVPYQYIQEKEISLFNAKSVYSIPMAEWAILKVLEIYKKSKYFYENQTKGIWEKNRDILELTGKTVAIIGFGSIGYEIAKRFKAFNVKIIGVGRNIKQSKYIDNFENISQIDKVLEIADVVILSLPLTSDTRYLINKKRLSIMKEDSVLINISRGGLINEEALIDYLKNDKFLGVALDVFEEEPLQKSALWDFNNVILTPHNSFISEQVNERLFNTIYKNLEGQIR